MPFIRINQAGYDNNNNHCTLGGRSRAIKSSGYFQLQKEFEVKPGLHKTLPQKQRFAGKILSMTNTPDLLA